MSILHEKTLGDSAKLCETKTLIEMQGMNV